MKRPRGRPKLRWTDSILSVRRDLEAWNIREEWATGRERWKDISVQDPLLRTGRRRRKVRKVRNTIIVGPIYTCDITTLLRDCGCAWHHEIVKLFQNYYPIHPRFHNPVQCRFQNLYIHRWTFSLGVHSKHYYVACCRECHMTIFQRNNYSFVPKGATLGFLVELYFGIRW